MGPTRQFLSCLLILFVSLIVGKCLGKLQTKIINGRSVEIEYFPFMASLQVDERHICGAAIIARNVLVTAAHCDVYSADFYKVRVGSTYYDRNGTLLNVKQAVKHPQYDRSSADYDIAILILDGDIAISAASAPIKLPAADFQTPTGLGVVVLGWGTTNAQDASGTSTELRSASLRTISTGDCKAVLPPNSITDRMVCAQNFNAGQDACTGDSGGPMVGRGQLLGIISWGMGCADGQYPGVYTNVPRVLDFINSYL